MIPGIEALACGQLAVPNEVMAHVVQVESSSNPYAIGVVGGRLLRQPTSLPEAVATARMLEEQGHNYSIGLAQVNRINFARFGLDTPEKGFEVCNNLAAGARILAECLQRHDGVWGDAFSCYYSGNARTGYEHGYVQKIFSAMADGQGNASGVPTIALNGAMAEPEVDASASVATVVSARVSGQQAQRAEPVSRAEPLTPEARLLADVQGQLVGEMLSPASEIPATSDLTSQQSTNSQGADAARVF